MIAVLLLTLVPADVSLYTVRGADLYRVDLTSGDTEQVAHWPVSMNSVVWDSDQQLLYGTSNGTYYKIDPQTWTPMPIATNVAGDGFGFDNTTASAYDPTTAMVWRYGNPNVLNTTNGSGYITLSAINSSFGRKSITAYFESVDEDHAPHFPIGQDYLTADPIDGSFVTFSGSFFFAGYNRLRYLEGQWITASTPLPRGQFPTIKRGAIAFYPGTHDLYQYTYDGSGFAWLSVVDLTTGELTQASPQFIAPAWFMFFVTN